MLPDNKYDLLIKDILNDHFERKDTKTLYFPQHNLELGLFDGYRCLISYFFKNYPFDYLLYLNFFKVMEAKAFFTTSLKIYVEEIILTKYFYSENPDLFYRKWGKKETLCLTKQDQDILKVFMFGIRYLAYEQGTNYELEDYCDYFKEIDQNLYQELVSNSNAELQIEVITTENEYFKATSNNVLASIEIQAFKHNEETFKALLNYINRLFAEGFPQNHKILFEVKTINDQKTLGNPDLPDSGANRLFNSAAQYHNLHADIETYLDLIEKSYGVYTDLDDYSYIEIDAFALFSLFIEDAKYIDRFVRFLDKLDSHRCLQNHIPTAFLNRHGITNQTVKIYLRLIEELLKHENFGPIPRDKNGKFYFLVYFNDLTAMNILLEEIHIFRQEPHEILWEDIFITLVGGDYGLIEELSDEEYVLGRLKSREIWQVYLMIDALYRSS